MHYIYIYIEVYFTYIFVYKDIDFSFRHLLLICYFKLFTPSFLLFFFLERKIKDKPEKILGQHLMLNCTAMYFSYMY